MIDIDNFKSFNDTYGHQQGDVVLRWVANALRETSRDVDIAARYGVEPYADFVQRANESTLVVVAVESPAAVAQIPAIGRVQGVDCIFVANFDRLGIPPVIF